jgi:hypothetical protein
LLPLGSIVDVRYAVLAALSEDTEDRLSPHIHLRRPFSGLDLSSDNTEKSLFDPGYEEILFLPSEFSLSGRKATMD